MKSLNSVIAMLMLLALNAGAAEQSLLDEIVQRGHIRIGTTGDFKPFSYTTGSDNTQLTGVDVLLAKDLAKSLDVEVRFISTSWPSLMDDLAANKFDIAMSGITITLARQKHALFSDAVMQSGKVPITRDENFGRFDSIASINTEGTRVIVNPGGTNESFARANFPRATIVVNKDNLTVFEKLVSGKADVMVTDAIETLIQEKIHPELEAVNPHRPLNFFEFGYLMKRDPIFKAYVDQWLNLRLKDGTYQTSLDTILSEISESARAERK